MYSALLLDDEIASINTLQLLLQKHCPKITTIYTAQNVNEASLIILRKKPDIVFSDIKMPDMNGIDFLNSFSEKTFKAIIITAYTDYGIKALKAGVNDYLVKPILSTELIDSVNLIVKLIENENHSLNNLAFAINQTADTTTDKILLKDKGDTVVVSYEEVIMIEAINNYSKLYLLDSRTFVAPHTLKWFNDKAPKTYFFRSHKKYLVNTNYIEKFNVSNSRTIHLTNKLEALVAANKVSDFRKYLKK